MNVPWFPIVILILISITAVIIDLRWQKIPNLLNYPAILVGLLYHTWLSGVSGLSSSSAGLGVGIALLIIPYLMGAMGAGDVKFLGAVGAFVGPAQVIAVFLLTSVVGGIYAVVIFACKRGLFSGLLKHYWQLLLTMVLAREYALKPMESTTVKGPKLCYGVALGAGTTLFIIMKSLGYSLPLFA